MVLVELFRSLLPVKDLKRVEFNSVNAEFSYLFDLDLDDSQIAKTAQAYQNSTAGYAELEWSPESVQATYWHCVSVVLPIIKAWQLQHPGEHLDILIGGAGTGMLPMLLMLLVKQIRVFPYDQSSGMVETLKTRSTVESFLALVGQMESIDGYQNGWFSEVKQILTNIGEQISYSLQQINTIAGLSQETTPSVLNLLAEGVLAQVTAPLEKLITSQLFPGQGSIQQMTDITFSPLAEGQSPILAKNLQPGLIVLPAVMQHLPKDEIKSSLLAHAAQLRVGGALYFDLRVSESGRVFMDTQIGSPRYFNTYTLDQVQSLITDLSSKLSQQDLSRSFNVTLVDSHNPITPHPDKRKPGFVRILITSA